MALFLQAVGQLFAWGTFQWLLVGVVVGLLVGLVPGLGGVTFISIALPFMLVMPTASAFGLLIGFMSVGTISDTIPAVLIGIPGSAAGQATVLDGHAMAKQGLAARALGASFASAALGGIVGAVALILSVPIMRPLVLSFGYPEFFMLALWGISMVARLSSGAVVKGLAMAGLGLLLGSVGSDARTGFPRWTYGGSFLLSGVDLAVLAMAFFAVPELISLAVRRKSVSNVPPVTNLVRGQLEGARDAVRHWGTVVRGGVLGSLASVIPGMGGSVIGWLAYGVTVQTTRDKSRFGRGDVRGVIGPDSAANASEGGHLIPTLGFGVPSTGGMAFLLVVFTAHGIQTGPSLLTTRVDIIYFFVIGIVVAHIIGALICFFSANQLAKLSYAPYYFLVAFFIPVLFVSAYQSTLQFQDVVLLVLMSVLAYVLRQFGWPRPPLLVGFVLSNQLEANLDSSVSIYYGFGWASRPIVLGIAALILIGLGGPFLWHSARAGWRGLRPSRPGQHFGGASTVVLEASSSKASTATALAERSPVPANDSAATAPDSPPEVPTSAVALETTLAPADPRRVNWFGALDLALTLALMAGIGWALWQAASWPADARRFPLIIGVATLALLALQVFNRLRKMNDEEYGGRVAYEMPSAIAHVGREVARRSAKEFGWLLGLLAAVWVLGLSLVMPIFTFIYLRLAGHVAWRYCLLSAVGLALFEWALFDKLAHIYWYSGLLSGWLASLGIPNGV